MAPAFMHSVGSIVGLGDPVMDIVAKVDHEFLSAVTQEPGGCRPVSPAEMEDLQLRTAKCSTLKRIPGGSAANVMKGLSNISGSALACKFMGMVGRDDTGREYRTKLADQGVQPLLLDSDGPAPSARALCLVTPDGQRTMRTCLGASLELQSLEQLPDGWCAGVSLLHCEGYCLYRAAFAEAVMRAAKARGAVVSIDLASFELVRNCQAALLGLLSAGCLDLVFANEEEAVALAAELALAPPAAERAAMVQAAQDFLLKHVQVSVVSMGPRGCTARSRAGETGRSDAAKVRVVDTIGAGDCFTAGFLYAFLQGADLQRCCEVGCAAGAQAVQAEGAELSSPAWAGLRAKAGALLAQDDTDTPSKQPDVRAPPAPSHTHHATHATA